MTNFRDPYAVRASSRQYAEELALEYYNGRNIKIIRSGFDALNERIDYKHWMNTPKLIRNIPDYVIFTDKGNYFIECKCAREYVHLKKSELESYEYWNSHLTVIMFVYSITIKYIYRVTYQRLIKMITDSNYELGIYEDNQEEYYKVPVKDLFLIGESKRYEYK